MNKAKKLDWRIKASSAFALTFIASETFNALHARTTHGFIQYFAAVVTISLAYLAGVDFYRKREAEFQKNLQDLTTKNTYLEHAAKILRHDMHSGINIYMPRGVASLERRIPKEVIIEHKLEAPLKLLKEGLLHTQKVYRGVKDFTNLVRPGSPIEKEEYDLKEILTDFLSTTAYNDQVVIERLPTVKVNESLFCTAVDNLIRNGLKYNDSETKIVSVYEYDCEHIAIRDNGRGLSPDDFARYSKPYSRRADQKEKGSGLGLNICIAILQVHGFTVTCEKQPSGTLIKIKVK